MKTLVTLLLVCLTGTGFSQMRQIYLDSFQPNNEVRKISFYSPSAGFVGFRDWIGYSTDSGRGFTKRYITLGNVNFNNYSVNLTFGFNIIGIKSFDPNNLIAYGDYGLVPAILRSTNGGSGYTLSFHSQFNGQLLSGGIRDMVFPQNGNIGYAVDYDRILKTTDQGNSWTAVRTEAAGDFAQLEALDNNNIYAISSSTNRLLRSTNAGATWNTITLPVAGGARIITAFFLNTTTGWLSMYDQNNIKYYIYRTTNGGGSWTLMNNAEATPFGSGRLKFIDANTGFALAGQNTVYKTINGGAIWEPLPRDNNYTYLGYTHYDLQMFSSSQLWAGGGHGFLELNTNAGGPTLPRAFFLIDTAGSAVSGTVNLLNYSRTDYTSQWFLNGSPFSTTYNSSYNRNINRTADTIRLVVSNGTRTDTLERIQRFHPPVIVSSFNPTAGAAGSLITITGQNFNNATSVSFGGVNATGFTLVSPTTITATVGAGASGDVKVFTMLGSGSLPGFTFIPPPGITSFSPVTAAAGATVTINGSNFIGVTAVRFAGVPASSFVVVNSTTITAVVPSTGSGSVSVTTPGGTATLAGFSSLPAITGFTPLNGTQGTIMTITGTCLTGVTGVSIGGVPALSFTVNSSTSITAIVGAGASGIVTVSKSFGSSSLPGFTWYAPPAINNFSPRSGPVGTVVTITGSGFDPVAANNIVYFGAVKAVVTTATATSLTVTVPAGATYEPISILANRLLAYSASPFLVTFPNGGAITSSSFANRTFIGTPSGNGPMDVVLGDLDGDGKPDMVVTKTSNLGNDDGFFVYRNTSTPAAISFASPVNLPNNYYKGCALGDLDGDGLLDIVVLLENDIKLLRNTSTPGNLSFVTGISLTAGNTPYSLAVSDIDGDGKADIALSQYPSAITHIYRNTSEPGNFSFAASLTYNVKGSNSILLADMDGDGKPELIIPTVTDPDFKVMKNTSTKGNISFDAPIVTTGDYNVFMATGDLDGDGLTDLASTSYNASTVSVIRNTTAAGSISFAPRIMLQAPSAPTDIQVSDMDGDGRPDIVATLFDYNIVVFKNTGQPGNPSFAPAQNYLAGFFNGNHRLALGDMNGDGKNEAVVSSEVNRAVYIHHNEVKPEPFIQSFTPTLGGAGTVVNITGNNFTGATAVSFGGVPAASFTVNSGTSITATLGAGATGDVVVTNAAGTGRRPGYVFTPPPIVNSISPAVGPVGGNVIISGSRFSSTPANNIVFFGGVRAQVSAATGNSLTVQTPVAAGFQPVTVIVNNLQASSGQKFSINFPGAGPAFNAASFATRFDRSNGGFGSLCDMDGDGKLDMVLGTGVSTVAVARNTGSPGTLAFDNNIGFPIGQGPGLTATGDLDGDGRPDIVVTSFSSQNISVLRNTSTVGGLGFSFIGNYPTGITNTSPSEVVIADLDEDGKAEIILSNYDLQNIAIYKNNSTPGNIVLAPLVNYGVDGYPTGTKVNDVNGDGKPEILVSVNGPNEVSVFPNTSIPGTISFGTKLDFAAGNWPETVDVGDIDGDGKPDLAIPNINGSNISVLRNLSAAGSISFAPKVDIAAGNGPGHLALADLDGDGRVDMSVVNRYSGNSISVFKNSSTSGNISFLPRFDYVMSASASVNSVGDMDGDGRPDLVAFVGGGITAIFRNLTGLATALPPDPVASFGISAFPNPVKDQLQLNGLKISDRWQRLELYGADGKLVQQMNDISGQTSLAIPMKSLPPGTYTLTLRAKNGRGAYLRVLKGE